MLVVGDIRARAEGGLKGGRRSRFASGGANAEWGRQCLKHMRFMHELLARETGLDTS